MNDVPAAALARCRAAAHYPLLVEETQQIAWTARADGWIESHNQRWVEYTGMGLLESQGWGWQLALHPDDLGATLDRLREALAQGQPWDSECRLRRADGVHRWFLLRALPLTDHDGRIARWVGIGTDVDERRRGEDRLRLLDEASARLAASLDCAANLAQLARLVVPALADACTVDLLDPRGVSVRIAEEPAGDVEAHGEAVTVALAAYGRPLGAITLRRGCAREPFCEAERALAGELARRAGLAIGQARLLLHAEEAVRRRDGLLAAVSHDLKTPLAAVDAGAALVRRLAPGGPAGDSLRLAADAIQRSAGRISRLVQDLLDAGKIEAVGLRLDLRRQLVATLVGEVVDLLQPVASRRSVQIMRDLGDALSVSCDRELAQRVLENLIANAVKFSAPGGRIIIAACAVAEGRAVRLSVSDSGPGIAADQLPRIFDRYWQAPEAGRFGTGLGLSIAKTIVEAHGGRIWADSVVGRGSTLSFTLRVGPE